MAFNVRIFAYRGIKQMVNVLPKQFSSDSVFNLEQPYEWAQLLACSAVAVSSAPVNVTDDRVTLLRIEVPDSETIRYEINPPGRNVVAGNQSPSLSGKDQFSFSPGWTLSVIDAAGLE
jgi:hypothetical protein